MVSIYLYFVNLTFPTFLLTYSSTTGNMGLQHWKADNLDRKIQQLSYYWYRIYQYHMVLDCDVTWWKPFGPYLSGWFLTVCIAHYVFWWPLNLIYFMETYQTFLGPLQIELVSEWVTKKFKSLAVERYYWMIEAKAIFVNIYLPTDGRTLVTISKCRLAAQLWENQ